MRIFLHKISITEVDSYVLIWAFFHIGRFLGVPHIMSLLLVVTLWSLKDMIVLHKECKPSQFLKVYDLFFIMLTLYGVVLFFSSVTFSVAGETVNRSSYLKNVVTSLLPFYTFYRNTISGKFVLDSVLKWWIFLFVAVAISDYYYQLKQALMSYYGDTSIEDGEEVINGGSYIILGLFPVICLLRKKVIQFILLGVCAFFIVTSFKRGPILIFAVSLFYYLVYTLHNSKNKFWILILCVLAAVIGFHYLETFMLNSDLFQTRLNVTMEGYTSSRDNIVHNLLVKFTESGLFSLILGHGAYGTIALIGRLAHNDWIQILTDQGIVGVLIHLSLCYQFFKLWKDTSRRNGGKLAVGVFVVIYFMTTLFSMAFDRLPLYELVVLGYFAARRDMAIKGIGNKNTKLLLVSRKTI